MRVDTVMRSACQTPLLALAFGRGRAPAWGYRAGGDA